MEYQIQPGYSYKGFSSGMLIALEPEDSETQSAIADGIISSDIDPLLVPTTPEQFIKFRGLLEETPIFAKVYLTAKLSQPVATAYSLVMNAIDNRNIRNLAFAAQDLTAEMSNATDPFSDAEIETINSWLTESGFLIQVQAVPAP